MTDNSGGDREDGLSGYWSGVYTYGRSTESNPFVAEIREDAGHIEGTTLEPRPHGQGEVLGHLVGVRGGTVVAFTKVYQSGQNMHGEAILYDGTADPAFQVIEGSWSFPAQPGWSGTFVMRRASRPAAKVARRLEVELPVDS
ncbi:MAG: hypothetical protein R3C52_12065 [Hyphomonadaceae bacterium]